MNKTLLELRPVTGVCIGDFASATAVLVLKVESTARDMRRKDLRRPLNVIVTTLPFRVFNVHSKFFSILLYFWSAVESNFSTKYLFFIKHKLYLRRALPFTNHITDLNTITK